MLIASLIRSFATLYTVITSMFRFLFSNRLHVRRIPIPTLLQFQICALALCSAILMARPLTAAANTSDPAPFGSNLFQGHFSGENSAGTPVPGDRLVVRLWNGLSFDGELTVREDGSIDLPGAGRFPVIGLSPEQLEKALRSKLDAAGAAETRCYIAPLGASRISVFVTGGVPRPGVYQGWTSDTVLAFLDRAGGVDPDRGSYRNVRLLREGREIGRFDLYPFVLKGQLARAALRDGDTFVVGEKGPTVTAEGEVRNMARFELRPEELNGAALSELAEAQPRASHVSVEGVRRGTPYHTYLPLREFRSLSLENGDRVRFLADTPGDTIMVEVRGAVRGASRFPLRRNARLEDLRRYISVDPDRANLEGLHIKRKSVAERQKRAIDDALRRLEQNAHTATSASPDEAQIRSKEAEMISNFVSKAKEIQPEGIVVIGTPSGAAADLALEDGDVIVIPEKSDVVLVSGEVMMPQAIVWSSGKSPADYIRNAGGWTARADTLSPLIVRPSGEVIPGASEVRPGDQILVLPRVESKNIQAVKDITQVLYQIAVAGSVVLAL